MSSPQLYDTIGVTYTATRRTEPRIAARVWAALGDARTVLNVGAGPGSDEPSDRDVTAVEPSAVMRAQRPAGAAPCVAATAESLPFEDRSFDAAMAFATVHHWQDPIVGLLGMRRVAAAGPPADVLAAEQIKRVFDASVQVHPHPTRPEAPHVVLLPGGEGELNSG